jgi:cytochrome c-type biogenesis protein CcmI
MFWLVVGTITLIFGLLVGWHVTREEDDSGQMASEARIRNELLKKDFQFRVKELHRRHAAGLLDEKELQQAEIELKQEAAASLAHEASPDRLQAGNDWRLGVAVWVVGLALAIGLFEVAGGWTTAQQLQSLQEQLASAPEKVLASLEQEAREKNDHESILRWLTAVRANVDAHPLDVRAWLEYARANLIVGRADLAAQALKRAQALAPEDPSVLIMMAQAMVADGSPEGRRHAQRLVQRVLEKDPGNQEALLFGGFNAFELGDYQQAEQYWKRLLEQMSPDSQRYKLLQKSIAMARQRALAPKPKEPQAADGQGSVVVRVSMTSELKKMLHGNETVFVLARAVNGPPMPLAVKRLQVDQLPATVTLTDQDAMQPGMGISNFPQIQVTAKVSPSGNAMDNSGAQVSSPALTADGREIHLVLK